jgi:beta-lactamase class C
MVRLAVVVFSMLTVPIVAGARADTPAIDSDVKAIIGRVIGPLVPANGIGGAAVAVRIADHTLYFNYGVADQSDKRPITSDSLFNVGSVRKIFEATLLAQAVLRGEMKLDAPVADYVHELHGDYIRKVTIGQLATHTSGLLLAVEHAPYPEHHYSLAGFLDALNTWTPLGDEQPGKQHIYTHAGYVLLQLALERRYGTPIGELISGRILKPLGMDATIIPERGPDNRAKMSPEFMRRTVQGYSAKGKPIGLPGNQQSYYDFPGTGQMFSSTRDLAILLAACLGEGPLDPQLRNALQFTQREFFPVTSQYASAMAWEVNTVAGPKVVDKPGGLNNAAAYVGLVPDRKLGIVFLSNRGGFPYEAGRSTILPELAQLQSGTH